VGDSGLSCLRQVNETIAIVFTSPQPITFPIAFVCECGRLTCSGVIWLTLAEYESLRAQDGCFAVRLDHVDPDEERVSEQPGYVVARRYPPGTDGVPASAA
jgi:hypothetical protein